MKWADMNSIERIELFKFKDTCSMCNYIALVIVINLAIRILFAFLRAKAAKFETDAHIKVKYKEFYRNENGTLYRMLVIFNGCSPKDPTPDLWYNSIIGLIELATFPILLRVGALEVIAAWITLKTVAQWSKWTKDNRLTFNRYLIGCATNVLVSFALMYYFIDAPI